MANRAEVPRREVSKLGTRACFSPVGHLMVQNFTYFPNIPPFDALKKKFFFKRLFIIKRQSQTEHEQGRGREEETQNPKQAPGSELLA